MHADVATGAQKGSSPGELPAVPRCGMGSLLFKSPLLAHVWRPETDASVSCGDMADVGFGYAWHACGRSSVDECEVRECSCARGGTPLAAAANLDAPEEAVGFSRSHGEGDVWRELSRASMHKASKSEGT
jgi:hypothetical protein